MSVLYDMNIYNCRPNIKRTEAEESVYDFLNSHHIPFERTDHFETKTIESCHEVEKLLNAHICKNLFLRNSTKTQYTLLIMCGEKKFVSKEISKKLGSTRLSFASEDDLKLYLNIEPGSVSIMGIKNDDGKVNVVIDADLLTKEYFCCHPCKNTSTLKFKTSDILNVFIPATGHKYSVIDI